MVSRRQRIAHIMPWDGVGGTEQAALRIGRAVGDAGFDTIFFCLGSAPLVRDFFSSAGYDTGTWRAAYPTFNGYRHFLHESMRLAKEFRRCRISLVHCGDVPQAPTRRSPAGCSGPGDLSCEESLPEHCRT